MKLGQNLLEIPSVELSRRISPWANVVQHNRTISPPMVSFGMPTMYVYCFKYIT